MVVDNYSTSTPGSAEPLPYDSEELLAWPRETLPDLDAARLGTTSPFVLAQFLERLEVDDRRAVLRLLPTQSASAALSEMDGELAAEVIAAMREGRAVEIIDEFEPDDAADIVAELEEEDRARLMAQVPEETRSSLESLLSYPRDTAGGIMTTEVDTAFDDMRIDEAIARIREFSDRYEDLHYVYVVDRGGRVQGIVSLRKLIQARPSQMIREVMRTDIRGVVRADTDQEEVARLMAEYNLADLAVVDENQRLLGIITHDDVIDVIQEEATEDLQKLSGAGGDESLTDNIRYSLRRRAPWLAVNLGTALLASVVIMLFEDKIAAAPILAALMPVVAAVGGNGGQQSLAVAIRNIATGTLQTSETMLVLGKQALIGLCNGFGIGLLAAGVVLAFNPGEYVLGAVIWVALTFNMVISVVFGALIPLGLKILNRDPAQSSSILLTTITDMAGFFIFLGLGSWWLL
jgi:magnesium transporter